MERIFRRRELNFYDYALLSVVAYIFVDKVLGFELFNENWYVFVCFAFAFFIVSLLALLHFSVGKPFIYLKNNEICVLNMFGFHARFSGENIYKKTKIVSNIFGEILVIDNGKKIVILNWISLDDRYELLRILTK